MCVFDGEFVEVIEEGGVAGDALGLTSLVLLDEELAFLFELLGELAQLLSDLGHSSFCCFIVID